MGLPQEGAVLVVSDRPDLWAAAVADRNALGLRTALLAVGAGDDPVELAERMAEEVFRGAPWQLFDARKADLEPTPGMSGGT